MQGHNLRLISLSLERSGRELDSLMHEIPRYGFWLGMDTRTVMEYGWIPQIPIPAIITNAASKVTVAANKAIAAVKTAPVAVQKTVTATATKAVAAAKAAPAKVSTFVNTKVIAPVQKASIIVNQVKAQASQALGKAVNNTITTLKNVKDQGVGLVNQATEAAKAQAAKLAEAAAATVKAAKDKALAAAAAAKAQAAKLAEAAAAAAKKVADGITALKKTLTSSIQNNINKFISTGKNLVTSAKTKITSSQDHLNKAKSSLASIQAQVKSKRSRLGFESLTGIQHSYDYIQFGLDVQAGKSDAIQAEGDAKGAEAAITDVNSKAQAGVTVSSQDAQSIGGYISTTISSLLGTVGSVISSILTAAKSIIVYTAQILGLYQSLESQMNQAVKDDEAANAALTKALADKAKADKATEEALSKQKEAEQKQADAEQKAIAARTEAEKQAAAYAQAAANQDSQTAQQLVQQATQDKITADAEFRQASIDKLNAENKIDSAVSRAITEGKTQEEAQVMIDSFRTEPVPIWNPPTFTPAEQTAAPNIASSVAADTIQKNAETVTQTYSDLASKVGMGMAVQDNLDKVQTSSDVNAIGEAVDSQNQGSSFGGLKYFAGAAVALTAGYFLLGKRKGNSPHA